MPRQHWLLSHRQVARRGGTARRRDSWQLLRGGASDKSGEDGRGKEAEWENEWGGDAEGGRELGENYHYVTTIEPQERPTGGRSYNRACLRKERFMTASVRKA